ncbi:MAG: hypothetical protein ACTSSH_00010 [Candidatus Heimdallarchaeota archaeon]
MLKLIDGKIRTWNVHEKKTVQATLGKYFKEGFGEALVSSKNS